MSILMPLLPANMKALEDAQPAPVEVGVMVVVMSGGLVGDVERPRHPQLGRLPPRLRLRRRRRRRRRRGRRVGCGRRFRRCGLGLGLHARRLDRGGGFGVGVGVGLARRAGVHGGSREGRLLILLGRGDRDVVVLARVVRRAPLALLPPAAALRMPPGRGRGRDVRRRGVRAVRVVVLVVVRRICTSGGRGRSAPAAGAAGGVGVEAVQGAGAGDGGAPACARVEVLAQAAADVVLVRGRVLCEPL